MPQKKILVIDDEVVWHRLLEKLLCPLGYLVYAAASCADGIRLAGEVRPDCIVLDFHLQDGDAVSVCTAIRDNRAIGRTPILIFSSDPAAEIAAYSSCRANGFLHKGAGVMAGLCVAIKDILASAVSEPRES
ncbi:MAG: response regulator [Elusimicrobia bacterium]|nr:response regulator [Elusimicrobiota bacterium]